MGAVLTPSLIGVDQGGHLPNASTFCGRCESVCPMRIPLPRMMRSWREREFEKSLTPPAARWGVGAWRRVARSPRLYAVASRIANLGIKLLAWGGPRLRRMPMGQGWTEHRDFPAPPPGGTFQAEWRGPR
jgi:L-lactate dehydrogenase complex protein LldF